MKRILPILAIIACIGILVAGQLHWNQKTSVTIASENDRKETNVATKDTNKNVADLLVSYTRNWPIDSVNTFQENLDAGQSFHIAFLGSDALGEGEDSWPEMVKASLKNTFGEHIAVSTFGYDLTSITFKNKVMVTEVIEEQPDLILFEPFTLKDNGVVAIDDSLESVSAVIASVKESLPQTQVILQPPHPLYKANYYPTQVEELQQFAEDNDIPYLNHWEAWPDQDSEEIKEYITEDSSQPSVKGHEVWAEYLIDYFIAE